MNRRRLLWSILALTLVTALVLAVGFVLWATATARPMPEAVDAVEKHATLIAAQGDWTVFRPGTGKSVTGLVFYPGARIEPAAYAPPMVAIAEHGYLVVAVDMPLNLAFLDSDRADAVIATFPEIDRWVVGGHSLGGAMAAKYASSGPSGVDGLVMWAAYPGGGDDLSGLSLAVCSIYATEDGLTTPQDIDASRQRLPADTMFVAIEGGNHAQFGWYGEQDGDGRATITRTEQQAQAVAATLELMSALEQ